MYLVEELFASCAGQDGKLQLSIHGCNPDIYLSEKTLTLRYSGKRSRLCDWKSIKEHEEEQLGKKGTVII